MKRGLITLVSAVLIFTVPILCGFLWGLHEAQEFVPRHSMSPAEIEETKAFIIHRWTGSGMIWGLIFLVYALVMRIIFWIFGGIANAGFKLLGMRKGKESNQ